MNDLNARLEVLRQRFVLRAQQEADMLERLCASADWNGVRDIAHGLSGRAGMFGYHDIGDVARRVEEKIDDGRQPRDDAAELVAQMRSLDQGR